LKPSWGNSPNEGFFAFNAIDKGRDIMKNARMFLVMLAMLLPILVAGCAGKAGSWSMGGGGHDHKMHHFHMMMNHGLSMVTEGSNDIMLAYMEMAPKVDAIAHEHGHHMMNTGKDVINRALSGPEMMQMMKGAHGMSDLMNYTHELGESMLVVVNILEKMAKTGGPISEDMMTMHHQHVLINHAMDMAAQGANIVMIGQAGKAGDFDTFTVAHGKKMVSNAQSMLTEVLGGTAMMDMHKMGKTPEGHADMMATHKLGEAALKVVHLLNNMPAM
jgi:hypothetical protein